MKYDSWERVDGGIILFFQHLEDDDPVRLKVDTADLIELRNDVQEAIHDSRGYRAVDVLVRDILPKDLVYILGNHYTVDNLLSAKTFADETEYVIQFNNGAFAEIGCELILPHDQQVTVYRRAEDANL